MASAGTSSAAAHQRLCLSRAVGKTGFQLVMTLLQLFLFVARVSGVTPLAGPEAKKKAVTRRPRTGKIHSKK